MAWSRSALKWLVGTKGCLARQGSNETVFQKIETGCGVGTCVCGGGGGEGGEEGGGGRLITTSMEGHKGQTRKGLADMARAMGHNVRISTKGA